MSTLSRVEAIRQDVKSQNYLLHRCCSSQTCREMDRSSTNILVPDFSHHNHVPVRYFIAALSLWSLLRTSSSTTPSGEHLYIPTPSEELSDTQEWRKCEESMNDLGTTLVETRSVCFVSIVDERTAPNQVISKLKNSNRLAKAKHGSQEG